MGKRLLDANGSDFAAMNARDLVESIRLSEGRVVAAEVIAVAPPLLDKVSNPELAAGMGADLILLNGAGYAKWVNKVTLPWFRVVNTSAGFKDRYLEAGEILTHSHGSGGEHAHETLAFTTWIDFSLAAGQAKAITEALGRKRPELKGVFQKNFQKLEQDLLKLDRDLKTLISKDPSRPLVLSHPIYDYFARRYGLNIKSLHWEPDEIATNEQMMKLNRILKVHPAKWMIWEGKPMQESVERLQAIGLDSLVFDPCGNTPDQRDFLNVMRQNVDNLKPVFQ